MVLLGEEFPNFQAKTTDGTFYIHDYIDNSWCILFSHPHDFTPVCTTELARFVELKKDFDKRGVKLIGLSCNDSKMHEEWMKDIAWFAKMDESRPFPFPIIDDKDRKICYLLNMIDKSVRDSFGDPISARTCFIIGPDKKLKLSLMYPITTGRNIDEILRCVDSLQLSQKHRIATPVNWQPGDKCLIPSYITQSELNELFPGGYEEVNLPSKKNYMKFTNITDQDDHKSI